MDKKGFTLVELLGVIVILGVLILVVAVSVKSVLKSSKGSLSDVQIKSIEEAAKMYYLKNGIDDTDYEQDEFKKCINITELISEGYLDAEVIKNPKDNNEMLGSVNVIYRANQYTYYYQDSECSNINIEIVCEAVTENTKTEGNVPLGNYEAGDEYICEVNSDTKYHFFVLGVDINNSEKVNLIMNRNIIENKHWLNVSDYLSLGGPSLNGDEGACDNGSVCASAKYGPVTVMNELYNATKDWTNIPNIEMNYIDEGGNYGAMASTGTTTSITKLDGSLVISYENLKARLITKAEAEAISDIDIDVNLDPAFWGLSSVSDSSAVKVSTSDSSEVITHDGDRADNIGVRPVISIPKSLMK